MWAISRTCQANRRRKSKAKANIFAVALVVSPNYSYHSFNVTRINCVEYPLSNSTPSWDLSISILFSGSFELLVTRGHQKGNHGRENIVYFVNVKYQSSSGAQAYWQNFKSVERAGLITLCFSHSWASTGKLKWRF